MMHQGALLRQMSTTEHCSGIQGGGRLGEAKLCKQWSLGWWTEAVGSTKACLELALVSVADGLGGWGVVRGLKTTSA